MSKTDTGKAHDADKQAKTSHVLGETSTNTSETAFGESNLQSSVGTGAGAGGEGNSNRPATVHRYANTLNQIPSRNVRQNNLSKIQRSHGNQFTAKVVNRYSQSTSLKRTIADPAAPQQEFAPTVDLGQPGLEDLRALLEKPWDLAIHPEHLPSEPLGVHNPPIEIAQATPTDPTETVTNGNVKAAANTPASTTHQPATGHTESHGKDHHDAAKATHTKEEQHAHKASAEGHAKLNQHSQHLQNQAEQHKGNSGHSEVAAHAQAVNELAGQHQQQNQQTATAVNEKVKQQVLPDVAQPIAHNLAQAINEPIQAVQAFIPAPHQSAPEVLPGFAARIAQSEAAFQPTLYKQAGANPAQGIDPATGIDWNSFNLDNFVNQLANGNPNAQIVSTQATPAPTQTQNQAQATPTQTQSQPTPTQTQPQPTPTQTQGQPQPTANPTGTPTPGATNTPAQHPTNNSSQSHSLFYEGNKYVGPFSDYDNLKQHAKDINQNPTHDPKFKPQPSANPFTTVFDASNWDIKKNKDGQDYTYKQENAGAGGLSLANTVLDWRSKRNHSIPTADQPGGSYADGNKESAIGKGTPTTYSGPAQANAPQQTLVGSQPVAPTSAPQSTNPNTSMGYNGGDFQVQADTRRGNYSKSDSQLDANGNLSSVNTYSGNGSLYTRKQTDADGSSSTRLNQRGEFDNSTYKAESTKDNVTSSGSTRLQGTGLNSESNEVDAPNKTTTTRSGTSGTWTATDYKTNKYAPNSKEYMRDGKEEDVTYNEKYATGNTSQTSVKQTTGNTTTTTKTGSSYNTDWRDTSNQNVKYNNNPLYTQDGKDTEATSSVKTGTGSRKSEDWSETAVTGPDSVTKKKSSTTIKGDWDETSDSRVTYNGSNRDNKLDETTNKASTGTGTRTTSDSSTETKLEDYKPDKNSYGYITEKNSTTNNSTNGSWQDKDVKQTNYGQNNKDGKSSEIATNVKSGTGTQTVATTGYDYKNQQVDDKSNTIDSVSKKDSTTTTNGTWKDTTNQRVSYNNNFQTNPDGKTEEITDINKSGAGVRTQQDVSNTRTNEVRNGTLATTTTNSEKTSTTKIQGNGQDEAWNESTSKTTNYDAARNKDRKVSDTSTSVVTGTGTRTTTDYTKETDKVETWDSATAAYTQRGNKYTKKETATDGSWNDTDTKSTQYSDGTNAPLNKDGKLAEWSQTNKTGTGTRTTSDITDTNLREQYIGPDGIRNSTYTTKNNTSNTKGDWNESNTKIVDYSTASPNNKDFKLRETSTYSKGGNGTLDTYDRSTEDKVEQRNGTSATVNTISTKDSGSTLNGKWNNSESKTTDYGGDNRDDKVFTTTGKSSSGAGTYTQTEKSREDNRSESYDDSGNSTVESKKNTYKTTTIDGTDENGNPANWRNEDTSYTRKDNRNWEKTSNVKSGTGTLNETEDTTETRKDVDNGGRVASNFDKTTTKTSSQNGTWDNVSSTQKRDGYRYDSSTVSNWGSGTRNENSTSVQKGYQKGTGDDARDYTDTTTRSNKTIQGSNWTNTESSSASFGGGLSYSNKTSGMLTGRQSSRDYQSVRGKPSDEAPNPARPKQDEVTIWQQDYQGPQRKASYYSEDKSDPNHTSSINYTKDGPENTYNTTGYAKVTDRNVSVGGTVQDTLGWSGEYKHTDKGKIGSVNISNDFSARGVAGIDSKANGSASIGLDGLQLKGDVSVKAGLSGTLTDKTTFGDAKNNVTNNAQVDGLVGGEAKASGQLGITTDGVMATGDASAFAGAKVTGSDEMSLTIDGHKLGSVTVSGEASAGIGASAKGTFSIDWKTGTVTLGGSLAATLGVGLGAGVEVKLSFKELAALGIDLGGQLLGSIKDKVVQGVQNYLNAHPQVKAAVEGAVNMAKSFGASAVSFGKDAIHVISDMGHTIAKVGGEAWHLITHPGEAMKAFGSMANQAGQMMSNAFNDVVNWATPGVQSVLQFGQNLVNGIGTGVNNLINFGKGVVGQIGDLAQGALKFGGDVLNNISNMAQGAIQFGGQVISNIGNMAQGLWSFGSGVVSNIGAGFNNLVSFGGQMLSNVGQWFGNLGNIGSGLVSFAADKLAGLGSLGDSVLSFLEGLVSKAKSVVGWIPGVGAALDAVQHKLEQGRQLINAAINGAKPLQGKASAAASKASSVASAGISAAQSKAQSATQAGQTAKQTVDTKVQSAHQTAQAAHQTAQGVVTASNAAINSEHQKTQAKVQQTNQAVNQEHTQMQTISQGAMAAVSGLVGTVQGKATAAHSKTSAAWTEAQTVAAGAQGIVTGAWSKVTSFATAALANAEGRASQVQATASAAAGLVGNEVPLVQKAVDTAHSTIEKGSQAATQKAETTWNTASNFIKGEAIQVGAGISAIGNNIKAGGQAATAKVEQMAAHADGIVAETGARIQAAGKQGPAAVEAVIEGAKAQLTGIKSSAHSSGEEVLNNAKSGKAQAESSGESAKFSAKGQVEGATNQVHQEGEQLTTTARGVEGQARTSAQAGQQKANEEQGKVHQQVQSNVATSQQQATQGHAQAEGAHATTEQKHSEVNQKSGHAKQTQEQAHSELAQAQHEADNHIQQQHSKVEQAHQTAHTNIQGKMTELQTHKAASETAIHGKQQEMQQAQTTANQTIQTQHNEVATTKASAEQTIQSQHQSLQEHQQTAQSQAQEETNNLNQTHQEVQGGTDSAASQINSAR